MNKSPKFSPEVRERAVRMVQEHREEYHIAVGGSGIAGTQDRLKELKRENRELRKANEILKLASAFFAQAEIDCSLKN